MVNPAFIVVPALVSGGVLLAAGRLWRRPVQPFTAFWGGALGAGLGFAAGYLMIFPWPPMPPRNAQQWLFLSSLGLGLAALGEPHWSGRDGIRWPLRFVLAALLVGLSFQRFADSIWGPIEAAMWLSLMTASVVILWEAADSLAVRRPGVAVPALFWLLGAGGSACLMISGSASLAQLMAILAAMAAAAGVLALWAPSLSLGHGAVAVLVPLYITLLWQGHFFAEMPLAAAFFLILAPLGGWAGEWPGLERGPAWRRVGTALAAAAVPVLLALAAVWWVHARSGGSSHGY